MRRVAVKQEVTHASDFGHSEHAYRPSLVGASRLSGAPKELAWLLGLQPFAPGDQQPDRATDTERSVGELTSSEAGFLTTYQKFLYLTLGERLPVPTGQAVTNCSMSTPGARGQGVGRLLLLDALITSTEQAGIWTIQSGIFPENTNSASPSTNTPDSAGPGSGSGSASTTVAGATSSWSSAAAPPSADQPMLAVRPCRFVRAGTVTTPVA